MTKITENDMWYVPAWMRKKYREALQKRSRKSAIRTFCLVCVDNSPDEVRECVSPKCPLYRYRIDG